jgi:hypothetical protein
MNLTAGNADTRTVVVHEFGHFLGLWHGMELPGVMATWLGAVRTELARDDRNGVKFLYSPDIGSATTATDVAGLVHEYLTTKVHTSELLGDPVMGVQRTRAGRGAIHLYDEFENLGDASSGECESRNPDPSDDGVDIPRTMTANSTASITVRVTFSRDGGRYDPGNARLNLYVNAWCDWNGDGVWGAGAEKILNLPGIAPEQAPGALPAGWERVPDRPLQIKHIFTVTVPADVAPRFWCRFRLDYGEDAGDVARISADLNQAEGLAQWGEVEDYEIARGARIEPDRNPDSPLCLSAPVGASKTCTWVVNARGSPVPSAVHGFMLSLAYDPNVITVNSATVIAPGFSGFSTTTLASAR